jgi:ribonuclease HI
MIFQAVSSLGDCQNGQSRDDYNTNIAGIGIVIHESNNPRKNRNGIVIDEISESYIGIQSGKIELLAVFRALEIAIEREYQNIRTRSDYNSMRKSLKKSYDNNIGHDRSDLHGEIIRMTQRLKNVHFGYKPRRKNQMAHRLAYVATKEIEPVMRTDLLKLCNTNDIKGAG